jgi:hypothetical protein
VTTQPIDQARFLLVVPAADAPDILGVWQTAPAPHSFSPDAAGADTLLWRVDLPADRQSAAAILQQRAGLLAAAWQALSIADRRLNAFVQNAHQAAIAPASFALFEHELPAPERELADWLLAMRGQESFFPGEDLIAGWQENIRQAWGFVEQVRLAMAHFARVETASGGRLLGRTTVGWLGDVETTWRIGLDLEWAAAHRRALELALESRRAWSRTVLHVTVGAARLSALIGMGGPLLAIPAAWKFIKQLLADIRQIQESVEV